jgi:hypothetical protein
MNSSKVPVLYSVEDLMQEKLPNFFYAEQLTKTEKPDNKFFLIEKILKEKVVKGKKLFYVKFLYYPDKFNLWVPESDITKNYEKLLN